MEEELYDYVDVPERSTNDAITWEPIVSTPPPPNDTSRAAGPSFLATVESKEPESAAPPGREPLEIQMPKARKPCMVFHHRLSDAMLRPLLAFAKLFGDSPAPEFQSHWEKFLVLHRNQIHEEKQRVTEQGFEGDFLHKLYRSARYYLRHKEPTVKVHPLPRTPAISQAQHRKNAQTRKELTRRIADHIRQQSQLPCFTPQRGYDHFCETQRDFVQQQLDHYMVQENYTEEEAEWKLKKCYKNKFAAMNMGGGLLETHLDTALDISC